MVWAPPSRDCVTGVSRIVSTLEDPGIGAISVRMTPPAWFMASGTVIAGGMEAKDCAGATGCVEFTDCAGVTGCVEFTDCAGATGCAEFTDCEGATGCGEFMDCAETTGCVEITGCGRRGATAKIVISESGPRASSCQAEGEISAIRDVDAGIRPITVTSMAFPVELLETITLELRGRLGCAIPNPSTLNSCVALPRWLKPVIWAIARADSKKTPSKTKEIRFIRYSFLPKGFHPLNPVNILVKTA